MLRAWIGALALALGASQAQAGLVTFDEITTNGQAISGFTDGDGVDVAYHGAAGWLSGYGSLEKVAYASRTVEVVFTPPTGKAVKLVSFDTAGWAGSTTNSQWAVAGKTSAAPFVAPGTGFLTVFMNVAGGIGESLTLVLGPDAYYTGFDNIAYSVTPIPAALPLLATAVGGLAIVARRRRKAA